MTSSTGTLAWRNADGRRNWRAASSSRRSKSVSLISSNVNQGWGSGRPIFEGTILPCFRPRIHSPSCSRPSHSPDSLILIRGSHLTLAPAWPEEHQLDLSTRASVTRSSSRFIASLFASSTPPVSCSTLAAGRPSRYVVTNIASLPPRSMYDIEAEDLHEPNELSPDLRRPLVTIMT